MSGYAPAQAGSAKRDEEAPSLHLTRLAQDAGAQSRGNFNCIYCPQEPKAAIQRASFRERQPLLRSKDYICTVCTVSFCTRLPGAPPGLGLGPLAGLAFLAWCLGEPVQATEGLKGWSGCRNGKPSSKMLIWATRCARTRSIAPCRSGADSKMCMLAFCGCTLEPWGAFRSREHHPPCYTCR